MRFTVEVECNTGKYTDRKTGQVWFNGCDKRTCEDCGPVLASGITSRVRPYLSSFNWLMTINLFGNISSTVENCQRLMLPSMFNWLKRNAGLNGYFWVLGNGVREGLHRHVLLHLDCSDREMLLWNLDRCVERVHAQVSVWIQRRYSDGALDYLIGNYLEAVKVLPKGTKIQGLVRPKSLEITNNYSRDRTDHYAYIYS